MLLIQVANPAPTGRAAVTWTKFSAGYSMTVKIAIELDMLRRIFLHGKKYPATGRNGNLRHLGRRSGVKFHIEVFHHRNFLFDIILKPNMSRFSPHPA
jgi:hypothetical protein